MGKKKGIVMICVLAVAVIAAAICLTQLDWSGISQLIGGHEAADYNQAATRHGLAGSYISKNQNLLVESIEKSPAGDTNVVFRIYSLAEGCQASDYLHLEAGDAQGKAGLTLVGKATATFIGDDLKNIRNLKIMHDM